MSKIIRAAASSFLMAGLLAVSGFTTYMWVSAAPAKVPQQTVQPAIGKLYFMYGASGASDSQTSEWPTPTGDNAVFQLPSGLKSFEFGVQLVSGSSSKVPTWYAFDRFVVDKSIDIADLTQMIKTKAAAKNKSNAWSKKRTVKLSMPKMSESKQLVVLGYVMNSDPTGESGVGLIDDIAVAFIESAAGGGVPAVGASELDVALAADTPVAQQLVMGQMNQPLYKFKLTANNAEDIKLSQVAAAFAFAGNVPASQADTLLGAVTNIRLHEGDKAVGKSLASVVPIPNSGPGEGYAIFKNLENVVVPKGTTKTFTIVGDIGASSDDYSGVELTVALTPQIKIDGAWSILATGASSGAAAKLTGAAGQKLFGNMMTIYKTKISAAHAPTAPSGASSKGTDQVVAKFVVSNAANVNNQQATIIALRPTITSSISVPAGKKRTAKIYKSQQVTDANLIASRTFSEYGFTFKASDTTDEVVIESDSSTTFTVTCDTNDAGANDYVTVGLQQAMVTWSDGVQDEITHVDSLPLTGKTLIY